MVTATVLAHARTWNRRRRNILNSIDQTPAGTDWAETGSRGGVEGEHVRHSLLGVWSERCDTPMRRPSEARNRESQGLELRGAPGPERENGEGLHGFV